MTTESDDVIGQQATDKGRSSTPRYCVECGQQECRHVGQRAAAPGRSQSPEVYVEDPDHPPYSTAYATEPVGRSRSCQQCGRSGAHQWATDEWLCDDCAADHARSTDA